MRWGAFYSAVLHFVMVALALGILPQIRRPLSELPPAVPIELVSIDEITNIKPLAKAEKEPEELPEEKAAKPEPEPMRQAALPSEPEPTPALDVPPPPMPEPLPEQVPEPLPVPEPKPEKKAEPEAEKISPAPPPTAAARPRVKPKVPVKKSFDADKIAALLNKLPPKEEADLGPDAVPASDTDQLRGVGAQTALTISDIDALKAQMRRCWTVQAGAANAADLIVTVRIWLNPDGTLSRPPEIVEKARLAMGDQFFRVAAESALRAVRLCQPYRLPIERYASWREFNFKFDPRDMIGG